MLGQNVEQEIGQDSLAINIMPVDSNSTDTILPVNQEKSILDHEVEYDAIDSIIFDLNKNEVY